MNLSLSIQNITSAHHSCSVLRQYQYKKQFSSVSSRTQHVLLDHPKKHGQNVLWRSNPKPTSSSSAAKCGCQLEGEMLMMKNNKNNDQEVEIEEEECWEEMGRWDDKCKGGEGMVELLECLEREAIMGDDEGRDPIDYNRRAHIFDKSSRVFQALKEKQATS